MPKRKGKSRTYTVSNGFKKPSRHRETRYPNGDREYQSLKTGVGVRVSPARKVKPPREAR